MPTFSQLISSSRVSNHGVNTSTSVGVSVTCTSANTKGSYAEIVSSTDFDSYGLWVYGFVNTAFDALYDIAFGAAGSEVVKIANVPIAGRAPDGKGIFFPIFIPKGTRIAIRIQSALVGTTTFYFAISLSSTNPFLSTVLQRATTYGANTADSGGTGVDPGAVANTKSGYVEIISSTTYDIKMIIFVLGDRTNTGVTPGTGIVYFAVGAAGSEIDKVTYCYGFEEGTDELYPKYVLLPLFIPKGTRISAATQSTVTDATDRLIDVFVIGFD